MLMLGGSAARAAAVEPADPGPSAAGVEPGPGEERPASAPAEPAPAVGLAILLLDPERPEALLAQSEASIRAHLAARSVEIRTEPRDASEATASGAREVLGRSGAFVAFFTRTSEDGRVVLHMVRADDERSYRRSLPPLRPEQLADQDAVALIVQAVVVAVLAGEAPGMEVDATEGDPEPEPPPESEPPATIGPEPVAPRGRARLAVAYAGGTFAPGARWQHGLGMQAGWVFPVGLHLSGGYTWRPRWTVERDYGRVGLQRHPAFVAIGWHRGIGRRLHVDADLPLIVEWGVRESTPASGAQATPRQVTTSVGLGLRARLAVTLAWRLAAFAGLGAEIWPRRVSIAADVPEREVLLDPDLVRFDLRLGLEVRL